MTIGNPNSVDALGIDPDSGHALLVITDDQDWHDPVAHINLLQQKIGAYLGFLNTGQFENALPESVGRTRRIAVIQQFEPPADMIPVLDLIETQLEAFDVQFSYGPLPDGYDPLD